MRSSKTAIQLILPALILLLVSVAFGRAATAPNQSQDTATTPRTRGVAHRERFKIEGIVTGRDGNVLTLRRSDQNETAVVFTAETDFRLADPREIRCVGTQVISLVENTIWVQRRR